MNNEMRRILQEISRYQSSKKVPITLVKEILDKIFRRIIPNYPNLNPNELNSYVNRIFHQCRQGVDGHTFFILISDLFTLLDHESFRNDSLTIGKLDKQIRNLKNQVSSSVNIENQISELKSQIEDLKTQNEEKSTLLIEKQEDLLQKFLKASKKAFIIMPFQQEFDNVWLGAIKPACKDEKYASLRVDEVNLSSLITDDIEKYSRLADVVIVDLTGNNANVMFELGYALAKNKKPIVICQGEHANKLAFDVRGIRHISYQNSWLGIEELKKKIKIFIAAADKQRGTKKVKNSPKKDSTSKK